MRSRFLLVVIVFALVVMIACAGGNSTTTPKTNATPTAASSTTQITIGDGPSDQVASLTLTINSVTLVSDNNASVSLLSSPATVEVSSLAGTTTPLATVTVPAGQYLKATIALGSATITRIDPNGATSVQKVFAAPALPFTISLNPPFVSDGTARVINIDFDLHASVSIDANTGAINFNPIFLIRHDKMAGPPAGGPPNPFTGGVEHTLGMISGINGTSFTLTTAMGQRSLTFATNSSTVFKNVGALSSLQPGMLVMVEGQAQSDGSLLATGVVLLASGMRNATGAIGIVTATTGAPVTAFNILPHGINMPTMLATPINGVVVGVTSGTAFRVDTDDVDLSGLNLTFDASTLSPAQVVEVDATTAITTTPTGSTQPVVTNLSATQVQLEQQPVMGTISNLTSSSFTLTMPNDSAFATFAKTTTITVLKQPGTQLGSGLTLANGQTVVVRGLLFNNGGYKMVATRIGAGPS